jgi:signal transduction histidine kinase
LIFKEAVNNAVRFSGGTQLSVRITGNSHRMKMVISDDGAGFDLSATGRKLTLGGNGLKNIQHRAEDLKGIWRIETAPGKGTHIVLEFNFRGDQKYH